MTSTGSRGQVVDPDDQPPRAEAGEKEEDEDESKAKKEKRYMNLIVRDRGSTEPL